MKTRIILFLFCCINALTAIAATPTATFHNIWLEHNVMWNGEKCLKICTDVTVDNAKGRNIDFIAYLEKPKGMGHKDKNNRYCTVKGNVCSSEEVTPIYESSHWKSFVIYLPNDEIHASPGNTTYYVYVAVWDNKTVIGRSGYVSFNMSGQSVQQNSPSDMKIPCVLCHQTGKCGVCGGLGYTVSRYGYLAGQSVSCNSCLGNGKCKTCHGKGYSIVQNHNGNVYVDGVYAPQGGGSSGSSRSSSKRKGSCSYCGGTGVSKTPNSGGSKAVWVAYYNKSGESCPYCNRVTKHYHDRCSHCNIPR
ncbi:hypothetical protein HDR70_03535 [bacterium]|nr:hypothetical protein [bacterium]